MTATRSLLVELLVEELPPKALQKLGEAFLAGIGQGLARLHLAPEGDAGRTWYASPRRLAVHLADVRERADDRPEQVKLMPVSAGLDAAGQPTQALAKKLAALGAGDTDVTALVRRVEGRAETLFLERTLPGASLAQALQIVLKEAIDRLPIPKVMQYQLADGWSSVRFVRPAHGLVALHGDEIVPVEALGLQAGRSTRGHRFEAARPILELRDADSYARQLREEGAVIADFAERRAEIAGQLAAAAASQALTPIDDADLLDEVTGLVEWPNVVACEFDREFLVVPRECLVLTMKANQRYFPLLDGDGALTNRFLVVSNIRPADPRHVIEGNERVVRPRLADARFFFDQDRKRRLEARRPGLDQVVYHGRLGSQGERVERVRAIAAALLQEAGESSGLAAQVDRAVVLAKADLTTDMVGEFPELQGVMGRYYALHDGEDGEVAQAIEDHYRPRFAGDRLPRGRVGSYAAAADKLETLAGLFAIGQLPTGDKDPYALRRQALGVLRLLTEPLSALRLDRAVETALAAPTWPAGVDAVSARGPLMTFFTDRLTATLAEEGYSAAEIAAVLAGDAFFALGELRLRLAALRRFASLPEAAALAAANKRVGNILKKSADPIAGVVDATRFREPAEHALDAALGAAGARSAAAYDAGDYAGSLLALAALKGPVDDFFETVMVNAEDAVLRANRLALLAGLHAAMNRVADLSRLAT